MPDHDALVRTILTLAAERFGPAGATLQPGDDLYDALGIDSLQAMDLLTALEDRFDIEIPDYELQDVRTVASIARVVGERL